MRVRRKMEGAMWSEEGELKSSEASRVSIHNKMYHSNSSNATVAQRPTHALREICDTHGAKTH